MKKRVLSFVIALVTAITVLSPISYAANNMPNAVGIDLSNMNTTDTLGNVVTSDIFAKYQLTLVNFWATWCLPCREEMPYFEKLYKQYEDMGVNVLGVLVEDDTSTVAGANEMIANKGLTYNNLRMDSLLRTLYNNTARGIPDTYLVNSEGKVVSAVYGAFMSYDELESWILDTYVFPEMESIDIRDTLDMETNRMAELKYVITPKYAVVTDIKWVSLNPSVASVNENGIITAHSAGTTVITVSCVSDGKTYSDTCNVNVRESSDLEQGTEYFKQADAVHDGGTYVLIAHVGDSYYAMSPENTVNDRCRLMGTRIAPEDILLVPTDSGENEIRFLRMDDANIWFFEDQGQDGYTISNVKTGEYLSTVRNSGIFRLALKPEADMVWAIEDGVLRAMTAKLITGMRQYITYFDEDGVFAFDVLERTSDDFIEILFYERARVGGNASVGQGGDINGNGYIDAGDATLVLRHIVGDSELTEEQAKNADLNENGRVDSGDAGLILRSVL